MTLQTKITIIEPDGDASDALGAQIRAMGYDGRSSSADEALNETGDQRLIVIDASFERRTLDAVLKSIRTAPGRFRPVILAGAADRIYADDVLDHLRRGEINIVMQAPFHHSQFHNHIKSLARLSNIRQEFERRAAVLAQFGRTLTDRSLEFRISPQNATLLVAGSGQHFQSIQDRLGADMQVAGALTPSLAMERLAAGDVTALVIDMSSGEFSNAMEFVRMVRGDARYFHLPIVLIPVAVNSDQDDSYYATGVSDIVPPPLAGQNLLISVLPLMRIALFRDGLKSAYEEARSNPVADSLTGLYSRGVFLTHLQQMIDDGGVFSVALLSVENIGQINSAHGYAGGDKILGQIGKAVELLTRGEDLAARFSGAEFAVLMPGTGEIAANAAWKRILSVLRCTGFAPGMSPMAVEVEFGSAAVQMQPGESPEHMLNRVKSLYRQPGGSCLS